MRLMVVSHPPAEFEEWLASQRGPAREPTTESQKKGKGIFLRATCVMCHTIQGTGAGGMVGPDLTHLASRATIASGSLPNTRGHLGGWISDPQKIKPGVRMPPNLLKANEIHALLDYLQSLK
jgi:cytochrome c oxidase subunit 2